MARIICFAVLIGLGSSLFAHPVFDALASPKGVAAIAFTYAMATGVSNFLWAYDWTGAGASPDMNKKIQKWGGISAAIESWVLGGFIPFWAYFYLQRHPEQTL